MILDEVINYAKKVNVVFKKASHRMKWGEVEWDQIHLCMVY
jgi:hypothetical protein